MSSVPLGFPLVDIGPCAYDPSQRAGVVEAVRQGLEHHGFLYLRGLGLPEGCLAAAFAAAAGFFSLPEEAKHRFRYTDIDTNFGYQRVGAESLDPTSPPDLKESFTMRNAVALSPDSQLWPDPAFRQAALSLYAEGLGAACRVLNIIGAGLALPRDFFTKRHRGESVSLRLLHYPTDLAIPIRRQLGAGAHTDYGSITLLFQDAVGGLEVRSKRGEWIPVPYIPDTVVVNTGDLMERWTNGRFRSTPHRVRPISGNQGRYSIALFVDPDPSVVVDCIPSCAGNGMHGRYPPITAGEHIRQKIAVTHGTLT